MPEKTVEEIADILLTKLKGETSDYQKSIEVINTVKYKLIEENSPS